ncbi:MAG: SDR family oxidoreductase [Deltaproteobacteria bacterium]|nr:SDR family oxidoreductase [Deltaproteobacteria bacterium]MBW2359846.1 SDR family oxidoreductase [Deltaproteobacteria bacterium]
MQPSVLVTGASSGIGASTAKRLAEHGFRVFGTSRHPAQHVAAAAHVEWIEMDVHDDASVAKGVAEAAAAAGGLDALVCNAGYGIFGSIEEVTLEAARAQFETNFFGVLRCVRAALPDMRRAGRGRIVLVGSLAGRAPIPFQAHYSATKAAIESMALALRNELHPTGVKVVLVEPGDIDTGFNDVMDWGDPGASAYAERARAAERVIRESLPRAPGPDVVARAIHTALCARRPRVRYTIGAETALTPIGKRWLPDGIFLRLIRKHFDV